MATNHWDEFWAGSAGEDAMSGAQKAWLQTFWRSVFAEIAAADTPPAVIIDCASGSGGVFRHAVDMIDRSKTTLLSIDYSPAALRSLAQRLNLPGVAADLRSPPLDCASVDMVVSQFGLEYAGDAAFLTVAEILKPGAALQVIAHYQGGAIEKECRENLSVLDAITRTNVLAAARAAILDSVGKRDAGIAPKPDATLERAFSSAFKEFASAIEGRTDSPARAFAQRLGGDLLRMAQRRLAYAADDLNAWFEGNEKTLTAYRQRMESMIEAALGEADIERLQGALGGAGLGEFTADPVAFDDDQIAAWKISARKSL